ncbi:TAXI family TRAP transporter solute-binding subunit [Undibacterium cyanobacteriorum]|uniref:TAXI family TRAP transporter solute-binding subunit n=1 Tax=Undibacterium cyanobacteriorum TaxID=3073561 RepID=A0ABY9RM61_9BURK|nr:TAXI family TRAP transporter solute-binding subunit [Undibacterium sp. 20NA77.5]WMW81774.1 TAXI family TRAP transporter solute-binding subunit [Undibacterium sp. 20NA77.5]
MKKLRFTLFSVKDAVLAFGPMTVLLLALLFATWYFVEPAPSHTVDFVGGQENSAYDAFAKAYATELAKNDIKVVVHHSQGSLENMAQIRDMDSVIDIGFVQSGSTNQEEAQAQGLISLGSLFYEPVWIFYRSKKEFDSIAQFKGMRVNLGPDGYGVHKLFSQIVDINGLNDGDFQLSQLDNPIGTAAFLDGKIDVVVMSAASDSLLVQMLLQTPNVRLFDFAQAEAYTRRLPFLSHVILPRGIVDIGKDLPARDYHLLAPTATLVAHESLHPALVSLFLQAAKKIHGNANWLSDQAEFPSDRFTEIPVAPQAEKFYRNGPPFLQRYLSFWMANFLERMWVVLLTFGALALPLSKVIPPLYRWRIRSRVYRWYGQLRAVEMALDHVDPAERDQVLAQQLQRLDEIEEKVNQISIPLSFADELYGLRSHINFVRQRLRNAA